MSLTMKPYTLKNQHGAVLVFSLVMLLLLTLASINMIRQNKIQISIATNAGQQITAFASVETALRQTQAVLEALRYVDSNGDGAIDDSERDAHHCKSGATDSIHPIPHPSGTLTGLPDDVTAEIQNEYCVLDYSGGSGNEYRCIYEKSPSPPGVRNTVVGSEAAEEPGNPYADPPVPPVTAVPSGDNVRACNALNAAGRLPLGTTWAAGATGTLNPGACPIEVYTLHVSLMDATTGAMRTVESKFEIDCSNDLNP